MSHNINEFVFRVLSSCRGDVNWPLRSCDLALLDFFVELRERLCLCG